MTYAKVVEKIVDFLQGSIVPLLIGVALVVFLWGIVKFIASSDNPEKRNEGIKTMTYGIIGLFVIVAVWGLVAIITSLFLDAPVVVPQI